VTTITGRCRCETITYRAEGEIAGGGICYCTDCQALSGGGPNYVLLVVPRVFEVSGEPGVFELAGGSGNTVARSFCSHCGTHLWATGGAGGVTLRFKVGSLDDPSLYQPLAQVWTGSAKPWHHIDPNLPTFEQNAG